MHFGDNDILMVTNQETETTPKTESTPTAEETRFNYELVLIFSPDVTDEAVEPLVNNVSQFITDHGGEVGEVARWGRKKLAYPIKHVLEGTYVLFKFKLDPAANKELETSLKISEKIIRYLLIKVD